MQRCLTNTLNLPKNLNSTARDLVKFILEGDPVSRPEISHIKKHRFFSGLDWTKIENKEVQPPFVPSQESNN